MAEFVFVGPFIVNKGDIPYVRPGTVNLIGTLNWTGATPADPYAVQPSLGAGGVQSAVKYVPLFPEFEAWQAYLQKVILHMNAHPLVDETGRPWITAPVAGATLFTASKQKFGAGCMYTGAGSTPNIIYAEYSEDFSLGTGDFCIEFWIYTGSAEPGFIWPFWYGPMQEEGATQEERSGFYLYMDPGDGLLDFQVWIGTAESFDRYQFATLDSEYTKLWMYPSATAPIFDEWVHYAVVRYGNTWQVYQNGVIVPTSLFVNGSYIGGNTLSITMPNITTNQSGPDYNYGVFRIPQGYGI